MLRGWTGWSRSRASGSTGAGASAPHETLLLLYVLGRYQRVGAAPIRFSEAEGQLAMLLREFGPPREASPTYPFHRLINDRGLWVVTTRDGPGSPGATADAPRGRDPAFRRHVLTAYEYQCAFCGYDGMMPGAAVGLDAAHVRWLAFDGRDQVDNGVCLCTLHRKLFGKGVLGLAESSRIAVSAHFIARSPTARTHVPPTHPVATPAGRTSRSTVSRPRSPACRTYACKRPPGPVAPRQPIPARSRHLRIPEDNESAP